MIFKKLALNIKLMLIAFSINAMAQVETPIEQLDSLQKISPRPVVFYFHTDWCAYCAMQSKQIAKDIQLKELLNKYFYFVNFNAESKSTFYLNNKSYTTHKQYKYALHGIVEHFLGKENEIGYPAWVITDKNYISLFRYQGLLNRKKLKDILIHLSQQ